MDAGSPIRRATKVDAEIAERVREQRLVKGMSQTELGKAIGVTFQQVQKYETGTNRIGAGRLTQIAAALDVPVAVLFGGGGVGRKKQRDLPSPIDDLAVEGAEQLLRAFNRITKRDERLALLTIAQNLARK